MPYYPGGDLGTWLSDLAPDVTTRRGVLHDLARGVEYLHLHHVIHCDLKLGNIFMDKAWAVLYAEGIHYVYYLRVYYFLVHFDGLHVICL